MTRVVPGGIVALVANECSVHRGHHNGADKPSTDDLTSIHRRAILRLVVTAVVSPLTVVDATTRVLGHSSYTRETR